MGLPVALACLRPVAAGYVGWASRPCAGPAAGTAVVSGGPVVVGSFANAGLPRVGCVWVPSSCESTLGSTWGLGMGLRWGLTPLPRSRSGEVHRAAYGPRRDETCAAPAVERATRSAVCFLGLASRDPDGGVRTLSEHVGDSMADRAIDSVLDDANESRRRHDDDVVASWGRGGAHARSYPGPPGSPLTLRAARERFPRSRLRAGLFFRRGRVTCTTRGCRTVGSPYCAQVPRSPRPRSPRHDRKRWEAPRGYARDRAERRGGRGTSSLRIGDRRALLGHHGATRPVVPPRELGGLYELQGR